MENNKKQGIENTEMLVARKLVEIVECIGKDEQPDVNHTNMETAQGLCGILKFLDMYKRDDEDLESKMIRTIARMD